LRKIEDEFSDIASGNKRWKLRNPESYKASERRRSRSYRINNPQGAILKRVRQRAKNAGLEFTLTREDIIIPEICPVLGIPLTMYNEDGANPNSPSVDRIDNSKGYTKDNIRIISWRANTLKRDATAEEMEKVLKYMKEYE